jgi:formate dehydrogenase
MINATTIKLFQRGAYLVNTAREKSCDRDAIDKALREGRMAGWLCGGPGCRSSLEMPWHGMTPHTSGTTLSAQERYAAGEREILECFLAGMAIREAHQIVSGGRLAGTRAHSYSAGNVTSGSEEAVRRVRKD